MKSTERREIAKILHNIGFYYYEIAEIIGVCTARAQHYVKGRGRIKEIGR